MIGRVPKANFVHRTVGAGVVGRGMMTNPVRHGFYQDWSILTDTNFPGGAGCVVHGQRVIPIHSN